jgi:hypothetical protein
MPADPWRSAWSMLLTCLPVRRETRQSGRQVWGTLSGTFRVNPNSLSEKIIIFVAGILQFVCQELATDGILTCDAALADTDPSDQHSEFGIPVSPVASHLLRQKTPMWALITVHHITVVERYRSRESRKEHCSLFLHLRVATSYANTGHPPRLHHRFSIRLLQRKYSLLREQ